MKYLSRISPALFVVIILCFFLPFIEISCSSTSLGTFSGYDVMMGSAGEQIQKDKKDDKSGMNFELVIAFFSAVTGLGLCFLKNKWGKLIPAILGLIGLISLLIFKSGLDNQIQSANQYMSIVQVHYKIGYWITMLFFFSALAINAVLFIIKPIEKPADTSTVSTVVNQTPLAKTE
jgi:hypothetical protein